MWNRISHLLDGMRCWILKDGQNLTKWMEGPFWQGNIACESKGGIAPSIHHGWMEEWAWGRWWSVRPGREAEPDYKRPVFWGEKSHVQSYEKPQVLSKRMACSDLRFRMMSPLREGRLEGIELFASSLPLPSERWAAKRPVRRPLQWC